jgi:predicted DNA-binding transcriptional regulator AlpA
MKDRQEAAKPRRSTARLVTKSEAAAFCGISRAAFDRICPIQPIELESGNKRLLRYDVEDIEDWIDGLKARSTDGETWIDISNDDYLSRLG